MLISPDVFVNSTYTEFQNRLKDQRKSYPDSRTSDKNTESSSIIEPSNAPLISTTELSGIPTIIALVVLSYIFNIRRKR